MNDDERLAAFERAKKAERKAFQVSQRDTLKEVQAELVRAKHDIIKLLSGVTSEWREWQLRELRKAIEVAMREVEVRLSEIAEAAASTGWKHGVAIIDRPLEAGGVRVAAILPVVDVDQLSAMRVFMVDKMVDVSEDIARKVKGELSNIMIGITTSSDAIERIGGMVDGGRSRAITIVRTEMGRAYSTATQKRQEQAVGVLPGLKKQWRRSGKVHSRLKHDLADGQIVAVDEKFKIGNVEMLYPRDPSAPASESINCGCESLPYMESWNVAQSGRQPLSDLEKTNSRKRDLEPFFAGS